MHRCLIFSLFRFSEETYKHTHLLSNVAGEDLLAIAADQPFRFPATFTFVVRAFSGWVWMTKSTISCILKCNCLPLMVNFSYWQFWMGLGKDLTQDLTSLRLPNRESWSCGSLAVSLYTKTHKCWWLTGLFCRYALELLRFREAGIEVFMKASFLILLLYFIIILAFILFANYHLVVQDLRKRWQRQASAFNNLFRQADRVEKLAEVIQRLVTNLQNFSSPKNFHSWIASRASNFFHFMLHILFPVLHLHPRAGTRWSQATRANFGVWEGIQKSCKHAKNNWKCKAIS